MHYNVGPPGGRGQGSAVACLPRSGRVSRAFLRVLHTLQILASLARAHRCGSLMLRWSWCLSYLLSVSMFDRLAPDRRDDTESPRRAEGSITTLSSVAVSAVRLSTKKAAQSSGEDQAAAERGFAWLSGCAVVCLDAILADVHD